MCLVRESAEQNETMAWMVEMERRVVLRVMVLKVKKGLPRTRKNRRLLEGRSKVTLRSLKAEILCRVLEIADGLVLFKEVMVRSGTKTWPTIDELDKRDG